MNTTVKNILVIKNKSVLPIKMLFLILLSSTIITLFIIIIQLYFEFNSEVKYIEQRIKQIERSYIKPITLSIWTFDKSQYEAQLNGILNIQDISYAKIVLDDGKILASVGEYQESNKISKEFELNSKVFDKDVHVGKLIVDASLNRVYDDLLYRGFIILLTQGIKTLIISFIILYIFHYYIIRHLYTIANYTKEIDLDSDERLTLEKKDEKDEIDYIVNVVNSMKTNLQQKQKALEEWNQELENKVVDRTKKLHELMFVQHKMASMGKMIENIAHQWRQPLASINASVLLIDKKTSKQKDIYDAVERDLDSIESITIYLSKTIDDIRGFYSKDKIKKEFYLKELIDNTINIISGLIKANNITINYDIENIKTVNYPNELQQVLLALILNAKDVLIAKKVENPTIDINIYKNQKKDIVIEIEDNANGIDKDNVDKIFDVYFTTKKNKEGTGIGLYMSRIIIEHSIGGTLSLKDKKDKTSFEIVIFEN
jgi:signal transduction histidine kinase